MILFIQLVMIYATYISCNCKSHVTLIFGCRMKEVFPSPVQFPFLLLHSLIRLPWLFLWNSHESIESIQAGIIKTDRFILVGFNHGGINKEEMMCVV